MKVLLINGMKERPYFDNIDRNSVSTAQGAIGQRRARDYFNLASELMNCFPHENLTASKK